MTKPESQGEDILGRELLISVGSVTADVFLRSGLPADTNYSEIELTTMRSPDEEISLLIFVNDDSSCGVLFGENHRTQSESGEACFDIGLTIGLEVDGDGQGMDFTHGGHGSMSLTEATEYLMERLPDFYGASGGITVNVPTVD